MSRLSVIIVNYNSGGRLARCLAHLARQTVRDFETIVVDNGSTDGSVERAQGGGFAVEYDLAGTNLGFAAANNRAAKRARGEWLAFLNPDAYAEPDWLEQLLAGGERYPWAAAFGSTQLNADDPRKIDGAGDVFHVAGIAYRGAFGWPVEKLPPEGECFSPCAAAAMYRRSDFERLGGFDERFFCYGEDVDLGFRLRLAGGRAVQLRDARVRHEGSGVAGRHSAFTVYHGHRNRIWLARKNMPDAIYWGGMPFRAVGDVCVLARMALIGRLGPYLRALRDGYFGGGAVRADARDARRARRIGVVALASGFAWSPIALVRRSPMVKPLDGRAASNRAKIGAETIAP